MYFSVIVTVYKIELPFLRECIESILNQTFSDYQLILVDDGSPDGCPALCEEYAARYDRVSVIHQPNGGQVRARQAGIQTAEGTYVIYVDGDDWIEPDFLWEAHRIAESSHADLITFAMFRPSVTCEPVPSGFYDKEGMKRSMYDMLLMDSAMQSIFCYLCGKAIRRSLLYRCQMEVDVRIRMGEDVACLIPCYLEAESVYVSHKPVYHYRVRPHSDSRSFRIGQLDQIILAIQSMKECGKDRIADFEKQINRFGCFICFGALLCIVDSRDFSYVSHIREYTGRPPLSDYIARAEFKGITPKVTLTFFLLRRNLIGTAYVFLLLCKWIKKGWSMLWRF